MKKNRFFAVLLSVFLITASFVGCSDEFWEDEDFDDISIEMNIDDDDFDEDVDEDFITSSAEDFDDIKLEEPDADRALMVGAVQPQAQGRLDNDTKLSFKRGPAKEHFRPAKMLDGTPLSEEFYFYRNTLSDKYKIAYDDIRSALLEKKTDFTLSVPVHPNDIQNLYYAVFYDSPDLFYADARFSYYYNNQGLVNRLMPVYNDLAQYSEEYEKRIFESNKEALGDMWSLKNDIDKVKYAHDYLIYTITYELGAPHNQNCYSALVNRRTVCAGYSRALQYLLQKVGVPCAYVCGMTAPGYHAWNLLKAHGEYYMMDVTWDDVPTSQYGYVYDYFCLDDSSMEKDHYREALAKKLPDANGTACSFQNAYGGRMYGTDFNAINGYLPGEKPQEEITETTPYITEAPPKETEYKSTDTVPQFTEPITEQTTVYVTENDNNYGQEQVYWWNFLNPNWTANDWMAMPNDPGWYQTYDYVSQFYYMYNMDYNLFYAYEPDSQIYFYFDENSYDWVQMD